MPHMPATEAGPDLYAVDQNDGAEVPIDEGGYRLCRVPTGTGSPFCSARIRGVSAVPSLYNGVSKLEIGVDSAAQFRFLWC